MTLDFRLNPNHWLTGTWVWPLTSDHLVPQPGCIQSFWEERVQLRKISFTTCNSPLIKGLFLHLSTLLSQMSKRYTDDVNDVSECERLFTMEPKEDKRQYSSCESLQALTNQRDTTDVSVIFFYSLKTEDVQHSAAGTPSVLWDIQRHPLLCFLGKQSIFVQTKLALLSMHMWINQRRSSLTPNMWIWEINMDKVCCCFNW